MLKFNVSNVNFNISPRPTNDACRCVGLKICIFGLEDMGLIARRYGSSARKTIYAFSTDLYAWLSRPAYMRHRWYTELVKLATMVRYDCCFDTLTWTCHFLCKRQNGTWLISLAYSCFQNPRVKSMKIGNISRRPTSMSMPQMTLAAGLMTAHECAGP